MRRSTIEVYFIWIPINILESLRPISFMHDWFHRNYIHLFHNDLRHSLLLISMILLSYQNIDCWIEVINQCVSKSSSSTFVFSTSKENKVLLMFPFDVSQRRTYKVIAIYIKGKCHWIEIITLLGRHESFFKFISYVFIISSLLNEILDFFFKCILFIVFISNTLNTGNAI